MVHQPQRSDKIRDIAFAASSTRTRARKFTLAAPPWPRSSLSRALRPNSEITTTVTHPAIVLQGHSAVAGFAAVRGCYSIEDDRVRDAKALIPVAE